VSVPRGVVPAADWVAPGVFSIPIPIEESGLPYVLVYALPSADGIVLIDAGWGGEPSLRRLETGLGLMGGRLDDIAGVIITHAHSDHYGLASRIREVSGAWVGIEHADAEQAQLRYGSPGSLGRALEPWLRRCGVPEPDLPGLRDTRMWPAGDVGLVEPDRVLADGDVVRVGDRDLHIMHTPGHSPGHVVVHVPREGLLFTGDHVLPHITPNVSAGPLGSPDPLGDYLDSLARLEGLGDVLALPAHGWAFADLGPRIEVLREHHRRRLVETLDCLGSAELTTFEVAQRLTWSRPLEGYPSFLQRAALGETDAHLVRLLVTGEVSSDGRSPLRWKTTSERAA
jgi:glyoxylase-like metal-dependent hydrolase (beta-lactamase superfamily II)